MSKTIDEMFEEAEGEFMAFDRIAAAERRHPRPDICAFLYLHEKLGGEHGMVGGAEHDIIYLNARNAKKLTQEDVGYLARCGVIWDSDADSLAMFV